MATTTFTIGQLAREAGVPVSTVRYYERNGILKPDARSGGNYRVYAPAAVERLKFIRASQAIGFSLSDIRSLIDIAYSDETPCDDMLEIGRTRLADMRDRLADLKRVERALARVVDACCRGDDDDMCRKLSRLRGRTIACKECCEKSGGRA
jgi:MerR family transcriptional regulator, mercuric resistance operon regulatory protein